jgi:hypothetical protein
LLQLWTIWKQSSVFSSCERSVEYRSSVTLIVHVLKVQCPRMFTLNVIYYHYEMNLFLKNFSSMIY